MKFLLSCFCIFLLLGMSQSACKHDPVSPKPDTTKCDTCHTDTTHHPCDTCNHHIPGSNDTTSHNFIWKEYSIPGENNMTGVWVFDSNNIWVNNGSIYRFNGNSWSLLSVSAQSEVRTILLDGGLSGFSMFAFNDNDVWLTDGGGIFHIISVTGNKGLAIEYRMDSLGTGFLHNAWGTSSNDMFVVGDGGTILHFDGTAWTKFPPVTTKDLRSIWGTSHNNVWAAGFNSSTAESVLLHFEGSQWTEYDVRKIGNIGYGQHALQSVWTADSSGHTVTITSGSLLWRETDSGPWRSDSGKVPNSLGGGTFVGIGVNGNSANDFMVTGGWGLIAHWNGNSWHRFENLYDYGANGYGVGAFSIKNNTACAVGIKNGTSWITVGQRK